MAVLNLILMSVLLGVALAVLTSAQSQLMLWVAIVCSLVFSVLMMDAVRVTRKTLFKVRESKVYKQPFAKTVANIIRPPQPHPLLDYHISLYYTVPVQDGSIEYVERIKFYIWLTRVWAIQTSPTRKSQQSPLSQTRWEKELGSMNRYQAYMYILNEVDAIDPESTYHVKKLRLPPWNIIILADQAVETRQL